MEGADNLVVPSKHLADVVEDSAVVVRQENTCSWHDSSLLSYLANSPVRPLSQFSDSDTLHFRLVEILNRGKGAGVLENSYLHFRQVSASYARRIFLSCIVPSSQSIPI